MSTPRVLVGTLFSGENELAACEGAVAQQEGVEAEQFVLRNLPNVQAHRTIYDRFMERATEFDVLVKVDADMVLRRPTCLFELSALLAAEPGRDHVQSAVHDWFSDTPIMGLHAFSPRVTWPVSDEALFVDPYPEYPGRRLDLWDAPAPFADHCPDPSDYQAFHFGVHRALKARQPGRPAAAFDAPRSWHQFRFLQSTWAHFRRNPDRRLLLAIVGADLVYRGRLGADCVDRKDAEFRTAFEVADARTDDELRASLLAQWTSPGRATVRHYVSVRARAAARIAARLVSGNAKPSRTAPK